MILITVVIFTKRKTDSISNYDGNSIIGTFLYKENNTKYQFFEDKSGNMSSSDYKFDYKYKIDKNILIIDFADEQVHDVKYTFELKDGTLKLISKEGTVSIGEEYILEKVNK